MNTVPPATTGYDTAAPKSSAQRTPSGGSGAPVTWLSCVASPRTVTVEGPAARARSRNRDRDHHQQQHPPHARLLPVRTYIQAQSLNRSVGIDQSARRALVGLQGFSNAHGRTGDSLVLDLLEWMGGEPRPYAEVIEAWRTSCPRLPVWEEANDRGFIERRGSTANGPLVSVSAGGAHHLRTHRRRSP